MPELDATDRRLIAYLSHDGRASVTTLAAELGVSRATVQTRLAKLVRNRTIRRFTIELDAPGRDERIHAVMMISVAGNMARPVTSNLRKMRQVRSLHSTNGAWDFVARIETASLAEFDAVLRDVREINGILNSETCLLLDRMI